MQQQRRATAIATSQLRAELSSLRTDVGDAKAAILRPQAHSSAGGGLGAPPARSPPRPE